MRRRLRKHKAAVIALAVYNVVLFFPVLFMGRVVSPNDVLYGIDPWATYRPASVFSIQNALLTDIPGSLLSAASLLRGSPATLHWNPYSASGQPGIASAGSPVVTPFVLVPALVLPLHWIYTGIVFLKLNLAFLFAYAWLREERMGKTGAAAGAIVAAGAGILAVRWFWPLTSAAALYPLLLWVVRRSLAGKRTSIVVATGSFVFYLLSASPAAMTYGAVLAIAWAMFLALRFRRLPVRPVAVAALSLVIALLLVAPLLAPFVRAVVGSGYLESRAQLGEGATFPASQSKSFVFPERLGNPAARNWIGDKALGPQNNFAEATVYVGLLTLPLVALSIFNRRLRGRFFWIGAAIALLFAVFGIAKIAALAAILPGFRYASITRLTLLLPVVAGFLAATGTSVLTRVLSRRSRSFATVTAISIAAFLAADLAHFAGRFQPYLLRADSRVPSTETTTFLLQEAAPFRVAPMFNYLWPNTSEFYGIEDLRSRFTSDERYRKLLKRIDPTSVNPSSAILQFNSLQFNANDPLVGMLGVRYLLEHKSIDILKWGTFQATLPGTTQAGGMRLPAGLPVLRAVALNDEPFHAIELPVSIDTVFAAKPRLEVALMKGGRVVWSRDFDDRHIRVMNKIYVPLHPFAKRGDVVVIRLRGVGMHVSVTRGGYARGQAPIFWGRVTSPLVFDREVADGRIFRHLGELPRFRSSSAVRSMSDDEFLATKNLDFSSESILTGRSEQVVETYSDTASVKLLSWTPAKQRVAVESADAMFLATSEKLTEELRVTIDGRAADAVEINMLFAGVRLPAGRHEVVFERKLGRAWWPAAAAGSFLLLLAVAGEFTVARRRR